MTPAALGHMLRYVPEDSGYKVDVSVAAYKKITSQTTSPSITGFDRFQ